MFAGLTLLVATVLANPPTYATPEAAARAVVYPNGHPVEVIRTNVAGRYATVLMRYAAIEGSNVDDPILVERFSFGWQALDGINASCRLTAHRLGKRTDALLMRRMPSPEDERICGDGEDWKRDTGPVRDIEALRRQMAGPLIPWVVVDGTWAAVQWYGAGGGLDIFRLRGAHWQLVADGGGAIDTDEARGIGIPQRSWCALGILRAACP